MLFCRARKPNYSDSVVVFDGNSITANYGWPESLKTRPPFDVPGCNFFNVAVGGQSTQDMITRSAVQVDARFVPGKDNVLIAWELGNDLYYGVSVKDACRHFRDYCLARKARGWKILVITPCDRQQVNGIGDTEDQYRAKLIEASGWLLNNWHGFANAIVESNRVPALSNAGDSGNFPDGVHPTPAALGGLVDLVQVALIKMS